MGDALGIHAAMEKHRRYQETEREHFEAVRFISKILSIPRLSPREWRARDHAAKMARKREARRAPPNADPTLMNGVRIDDMGRPFGGR